MKGFARAICMLSIVSLLSLPVLADVVEFQASKDNTLFETLDGDLSNGSGKHLFAGVTALEEIRRGLIAFDVSSAIPPGATIESVSLTLNMSKSIVGPVAVGLHRAQTDWGEGASDAPGEEGMGVLAESGDATWIHTFSPTDFWSAPGGDFEATPSATIDVAGFGSYTWSSAGMVDDVQAWVDDPAGTNFGWVVVADESIWPTAKRFDTRENPEASLRPLLTVEFSQGPAVPALGPGGQLLLLALFLVGGGMLLRAQARSRRIRTGSDGPA